jgi:hypothetical protein
VWFAGDVDLDDRAAAAQRLHGRRRDQPLRDRDVQHLLPGGRVGEAVGVGEQAQEGNAAIDVAAREAGDVERAHDQLGIGAVGAVPVHRAPEHGERQQAQTEVGFDHVHSVLGDREALERLVQARDRRRVLELGTFPDPFAELAEPTQPAVLVGPQEQRHLGHELGPFDDVVVDGAQHSDEIDEIAHRPRFLPCRRLSLGHPRAGGTRIGRRSR